jgi:excisionase family DNA binding protein|tara:strand:- start:382 stop:582 length:201 start_codon:yes stop_codon:yes gene_type:complete
MQNQNMFMNIKQVAEYLQVSPKTIRRLTKTKKLPFVKVSHKVLRFNKSRVDAWVSRYELNVEKDYA